MQTKPSGGFVVIFVVTGNGTGSFKKVFKPEFLNLLYLYKFVTPFIIILILLGVTLVALFFLN